ncbi:MAG: creatininase family protein [Methylobacteriaceae bacterium]|nr:creatininase family protein [Methylobacteriaceae bacterium]
MRLEMMTSAAVERYLGDCPGLIVPVGATEQHGPDALIGTDHLCAEAIARRCGREHDILVAPTLAYGMSQFHLGFPGTMSLRPSTLTAVALDLICSLAATGFTRIYFFNGHGGNVAPIRCAVQEYYAARSMAGAATPTPVHCRLKSWWEMPGADALRRELYGAQEGYHATPSEVAVTLAACPDAIAPFNRPPPAVSTGDILMHAGDNYYDAADFRRRYPDGRVISHSALATREAGDRLIALASADLAVDFRAFCGAE